jgi:hypothetical protein
VKKTEKAWNPRFVHYARVHGRTPEEQLVADTHPGNDQASMHRFVLWNGARLYEFSGIQPNAFFSSTARYSGNNTLVDHAAYDAWLAALPVGHGVEAAEGRTTP